MRVPHMHRRTLQAVVRDVVLTLNDGMDAPCIDRPGQHAFFFDFDGTLVHLAQRPELVEFQPETRVALQVLARVCDGAVAIVSGRSIKTIDGFTTPLCLPVAGLHGLERRGADGRVITARQDIDVSSVLCQRLNRLIGAHPGVHLETKGPAAAALHYREAPAAEAACRCAIEAAIADLEGIKLVEGKMVLEARLDTGDKGQAIEAFLAEPPFAGRRPVFAGDDVTDEDAFAVVNAMDGVTIKVGDGDTAARYRIADTSAFLDWLAALASAH